MGGQAAHGHHDGPATERATICEPAEHHEGQEEAAGEEVTGRLRYRYVKATADRQGGGAAGKAGRWKGRERRWADWKTQGAWCDVNWYLYDLITNLVPSLGFGSGCS